jgi:putative two-component system response regulator
MMRVLSPVPSLKAELSILVSHHERWDGTGDPHQLAGKEIPKGGRMIGVADARDFLHSPVHGHDPYPTSYVKNYLNMRWGLCTTTKSSRHF